MRLKEFIKNLPERRKAYTRGKYKKMTVFKTGDKVKYVGNSWATGTLTHNRVRLKDKLKTGTVDGSWHNGRSVQVSFPRYLYPNGSRSMFTSIFNPKDLVKADTNEVWGVPIPSTARPQGLKKVTKKSYGKVRTYYEPINLKRFNERS